MNFIFLISFVIFLRIGELILSKSNEKWLLENGAVEYGRNHYPYIVALHSLFLVSVILEYSIHTNPSFSLFMLIFYFSLLTFKTWVILSLGKFWNTRIYRIPNSPLIKKGPYQFFKHPNYMIVIAEIAVIPMIFNLYYTAIAFTILNLIMLTVRIRAENKVLQL
jgi:methyltransferase